jgi:hypothetical protein
MSTTYQLKNGETIVMETQCRHLDVALDEFVEEYPNFYSLGYSVGIKQD